MGLLIFLTGSGGGVLSEDLTATARDIFVGLTAITKESNDEIMECTMPDCTGYGQVLPINGSVTIPEGYYEGNEKVTQAIQTGGDTYTPQQSDIVIKGGIYLTKDLIIKGDPDLIPANIRSNKTIFGVTGTFLEALPKPTLTATEFACTYGQSITVSDTNFNSRLMTRTGTVTSATYNTTLYVYYNLTADAKKTYGWDEGGGNISQGQVTRSWVIRAYAMAAGRKGWATLSISAYRATGSYSDGYVYSATVTGFGQNRYEGSCNHEVWDGGIHLYNNSFQSGYSQLGTNDCGSSSCTINFQFTIPAGRTIRVWGNRSTGNNYARSAWIRNPKSRNYSSVQVPEGSYCVDYYIDTDTNQITFGVARGDHSVYTIQIL